jgi:cobalt-zinc-cadmium efflux system outer membrane protein
VIGTRYPLLLVFCLGCQVCHSPRDHPTPTVAPVASQPVPEVAVCEPVAGPTSSPCDLPSLWRLARANNPSLREAVSNVEAAQGRLRQAARYPNPQFSYDQEAIGSPGATPGVVRFEVSQPLLTAGKRPLDMGVAEWGLELKRIALLGQKFTVLTRLRRAYYNYVGLEASVRVNEEVVASIQRAIEITRMQVEEVRSRPRTDLLRLETLLEKARINLATNQSNRDAAWQQVATAVGLPGLPLPATPPSPLPDTLPALTVQAATDRVLAVHTDLQQAIVDSERARLQVERAQAEAIPDVTVAGGYSHSFVEPERGAVLSVQIPLPLWDRKQGLIQEAKARHARTVAFQQSTAHRLIQETATAFAHYNALQQQVQRLTNRVLPQQRESLALLLKAYQAGAAQVTFADVFQAQQDLNASRLTLADARRNLWLAIANLQGLMQIDLEDAAAPSRPTPCPPGGCLLGPPVASCPQQGSRSTTEKRKKKIDHG